MGHYDSCRPGYCPKCGAAPGNMTGGKCQFCDVAPNPPEDHSKPVGLRITEEVTRVVNATYPRPDRPRPDGHLEIEQKLDRLERLAHRLIDELDSLRGVRK